MAKFTAGRRTQTTPDEPQSAADLDLPVGPAPDVDPTGIVEEVPTGFQGYINRRKAEQPQAPVQEQPQQVQQPVEQPVQEPVEQPVQEPVEQPVVDDRFTIPTLKERKAQADAAVGQTVRDTQWLRPDVVVNRDQGLAGRAAAAVTNANNGKLYLSARTKDEGFKAFKAGEIESGPELATIIDSQETGNFTAAIHQAGAVETKTIQGTEGTYEIYVPNDQYTAIASAVVENSFDDQRIEKKEFDFQEGGEVAVAVQNADESKVLISEVSNARLGQQIHQEYQRAQGIQQPTRLPRKQAETVGGAYKELYAQTNPHLVEPIIDPATNRKVYTLNSNGAEALRESKEYRKRLFPSINVRPSKNPLPEGKLPGDVGATAVANLRGPVGNQQIGRKINHATNNNATVGHVVDKQRTKLLYSTLLPAIVNNDFTTWQAEANGIGPSKLKEYAAKLKTEDRKGNPNNYNPDDALNAEIDRRAQAVRSLAMERNGANYLTYGVTAYNGRIDPQQTYFDPVRSKTVRAVTRSATPVIAKPNSRADKNLRQMYAMMLVPKADQKLPDARELALIEQGPQLEQWGRTLETAITMTDEQYEAISQAIEAGTPLDDPNFPPIPLIEITDPALIKAIEDKGEDGLIFMDGLIDYARYAERNRKGQPHASYFNAYMDGKTNGLASNGMQMGSIKTAKATGVIRDNDVDLLDAGDIREQLKDVLLDSVKQGWDGHTDDFGLELNDVANTLYSNRDFNKKITMTWGYGKDIESFKSDIQEYLDLIYEESEDTTFRTSYDIANEALGVDDSNNSILVGTLLTKYEPALTQVVSPEAIESRSISRAGAAIHSLASLLFTYPGPAGNQLVFGRDISKGQEGATKTGITLGREKAEGPPIRREIPHYETEALSAAPRQRGAKIEIGGYARGGSVPGPVQSIDAATIAETFSGKSWNKLKAKSGGNPYILPIYDAVKVDANTYDVALEEMNKNWLDINMNWSYLREIDKAIDKASNEFKKKIDARGLNSELTPNERIYFDGLMQFSISAKGKPMLQGYLDTIQDIGKFKGPKDTHFSQAWASMERVMEKMKAAGFNYEDPNAIPTLAHNRLLIKLLLEESRIKPRLSNLIKVTDENKKKLKAEIKKRGFKASDGTMIPLQYYAH